MRSDYFGSDYRKTPLWNRCEQIIARLDFAAVSMSCPRFGFRIIMRALACSLVLLSALLDPALAEEGCDPRRPCDEAQLGAYVEPDFVMPKTEDPNVARGRPAPIPLFGLEGIVRVKPGSGLWVGEAFSGGNLFLNGNRKKATLGLKLGF